ncbi:hypothetical protein PNA2_0227 [Pyrococcus sp. NA2]|uniref:DUF3783 domain-containing protein n=1 Tax=Pyrococcus sp. (strain NA2) TaxID=342949 RepID=UPI000209AFB0|nr:DUF3783 domain-containing protein [Pyrococcus sp. NA2]AEC51145.1 hypothetical protein PNA2_0227 [Pyrococcus sp. NA2]
MGKILLIGFSREEYKELKQLLKHELVCVPEYCKDWTVGSIVERKNLEGRCDWHLRKFIIMHNLTNEEIKNVIKLVKPRFKDVIFATTTPTSLTWRLEDLLQELIREDEYFKRRRFAKGPFLDIKF